jgi:outer membrane protein assembly factor BamE (lipoprotein component of BamABCDE complex)
MMRRMMCVLVAVGIVVSAAGCKLTRKNYHALSLGNSADEVKKVLGSPRYESQGQWVYTRDDPRDLTKVEIYFDADKTVIGKSWQNPEKPWENHREGQVPSR